ncbi:MAG: methyltransferase domain-containing protein [Bdellovibrio sp.]|nr:methyltransferase domain-containing protein [Bdellovibrio sp.]
MAVFSVSIGVLGRVVLGLGLLGAAEQDGHADELRPKGTNAYQMVTGDDSEDDRHRWDKLFSTNNYVYGKEPARFLRENIHFFSQGGRALDLAMGEGRNAVFLAERGFNVDGVDISEVAIRKAKRLAKEKGVLVTPILADLNTYVIRSNTYDVILNFDFLQPALIPQIKKGLKKGGLVAYENYTVEQLMNSYGYPVRRDLLLKKGELKALFKDFQILVYREYNDGKEAKATLIARKTR